MVVCGLLAGDLWSVNSMPGLLRNLRGWGPTSHTNSASAGPLRSRGALVPGLGTKHGLLWD